MRKSVWIAFALAGCEAAATPFAPDPRFHHEWCSGPDDCSPVVEDLASPVMTSAEGLTTRPAIAASWDRISPEHATEPGYRMLYRIQGDPDWDVVIPSLGSFQCTTTTCTGEFGAQHRDIALVSGATYQVSVEAVGNDPDGTRHRSPPATALLATVCTWKGRWATSCQGAGKGKKKK